MRLVRMWLALGLTVIASSSVAQTLPLNGETDSNWRYSITGYAFLPADTSGSSTVADTTVDLELSFSDAVDLLDFAFSGRAEAWKGNWGIITDVYYVDLQIGGDLTFPGPAASTVALDVDIKQTWVSLLGAYRFAYGTYGNRDLKFAWDVSAGVRWNRIEQDIDVSLVPGSAPGVGTTLGGAENWFEPMVGLRAAYQVADDWTIAARAELGGFGVGDDDLQYTFLVGADWQAWERTSLKFGYQFYGIDFETERSDGTFAYDIDQHGPYLGITYRF